MAEPSTPGSARRENLRRSRWVATGVAAGAAVLLTGTIAVVNAAPSGGSGNGAANPRVRSDDRDDGYDRAGRIDDDEYEDARPFTPQQQVPTPAAPQFVPQPQTRTRGS